MTNFYIRHQHPAFISQLMDGSRREVTSISVGHMTSHKNVFRRKCHVEMRHGYCLLFPLLTQTYTSSNCSCASKIPVPNNYNTS